MLGAIVVVLIVDFAVISAGVLALISWFVSDMAKERKKKKGGE